MKKCWLVIFCWFSQQIMAQNRPFYKEPYRPQFHFTTPIHWMNDPNGLVYLDGEYHLFYQFNPFGNQWGHMSWGHAISRDLLHWEHLPLAIPEDKDTMIFSGSCVADLHNSSGFATQAGQVPLVAVYTGHIEGKNQSQHIAYSLDKGRTWTKHNANPVLDLGKKDFRDPKVFWYTPLQIWMMAVAWPQERQVKFFSSPNLKQWKTVGSFGPAGDTTGIWECPDLFQVPVDGEPGRSKWVLMLSPAPYMQYFIGEFDGQHFTPDNPVSKIYRPDYGSDYYAAIVYNNLPPDAAPISIGWVNNWNYANDIPTSPWKSALSLPRTLSVKKLNGEWLLLQQPVDAITRLRKGKTIEWKNKRVSSLQVFPARSQQFEMELQLNTGSTTITGLYLAKMGDQQLELGYDASRKVLYLDRSRAGRQDFHPAFARMNRYEMSLQPNGGKIRLRILFDHSVLEVFGNEGESVMTMQLFPDQNENGIAFFSRNGDTLFDWIRFRELGAVW